VLTKLDGACARRRCAVVSHATEADSSSPASGKAHRAGAGSTRSAWGPGAGNGRHRSRWSRTCTGDRRGSGEGLAHRIRSGARFDLNDFREQVIQMRRMGGVGNLLDKLPAQSRAAGPLTAGRRTGRSALEGIINSMTAGTDAAGADQGVAQARSRPPACRCRRSIAAAQFEQMQAMMKQMQKAAWQDDARPGDERPRRGRRAGHASRRR